MLQNIWTQKVKLTLGSNRQPYGIIIGLNFLASCLPGNPGTDYKSWICIAGGAQNIFLEVRKEKIYFAVTVLNFCFLDGSKRMTKILHNLQV